MKNLHFLLRYSDRLVGVDTIIEHQTIIDKNGYVWMGKFGVGVNKHFVTLAKQQLNNDQSCWLYLMQGSKITSKSNVVDLISANTSKGEILSCEPDLTPEYYRKKKCSVWFKLSSIEHADTSEIQNLWLFNNPSLHPSSAGMRGLIYLTYNDLPVSSMPDSGKSSLYAGGLFD